MIAFFFYVLVLFSVLSFFTIIYIYNRLRTLQRDARQLVLNGESNTQLIKDLESELNHQKKINIDLELSIKLKESTENIFLNKLNELKRKRHKNPELITKELHFQLLNLKHISKKNENENNFKNKQNLELINALKSLDKNLTDRELRLCCYFKLRLTSKEIMQFEPQISDATIRTMKNRIKKKLGIDANLNLSTFLNELIF